MTGVTRRRTGGQVLIDQLLIHGVDRAFCVPGESYLGALDALYDARECIQLVTCRHEAGACTMAEAQGKLTGRPGICFVTRGPGASHAMIGVHVAFQDSTPLILFIGQANRGVLGREALQEIDTQAMFGHTAKWAADLDDPRRLPEYVSRAFHAATSGRPGPVVLGLPEDLLTEACEVADAASYRRVQPSPGRAAMEELSRRLAGARRPVLLLGRAGWTADALDAMRSFAERWDLPVCASFRCNDLFDNRHRCYAGDLSLSADPALAAKVREADLLLAVGARIGEADTQHYRLLSPPRPPQAIVHVYPDPDELGRVYQGDLLIASGMAEFAAEALALAPPGPAAWSDWRAELRAIYERGRVPGECPGDLDLGRAMLALNEALPRDAVVTCDIGNFAGWMNRFVQFSRYGSLLGPNNGTMGYGLPAAISAKLSEPARPVLCLAGDGGFMMSGAELATAMLYGVSVVVLVFNNGMYGTIRMYQERSSPGRDFASRLANPDFAALARSYGAHGETVTRTDEFVPTVLRALALGRPAVIDVRYDPDAISARTTLRALREAAAAGKAGAWGAGAASRGDRP